MLSEIGVVFRQGVKNRFEVSLNTSSDNTENDYSSKSCSPSQDQKMNPSTTVRRNALDSSSVIENNVLEPTSPMPMLALPSTRLLRTTERAYTGLNILVIIAV